MRRATKGEVAALARKALGPGAYPSPRRTHGAWWCVELCSDAAGKLTIHTSFEAASLAHAYGEAASWLRSRLFEQEAA